MSSSILFDEEIFIWSSKPEFSVDSTALFDQWADLVGRPIAHHHQFDYRHNVNEFPLNVNTNESVICVVPFLDLDEDVVKCRAQYHEGGDDVDDLQSIKMLNGEVSLLWNFCAIIFIAHHGPIEEAIYSFADRADVVVSFCCEQ